jgi:translocation and assembly module TamB
LRAAELRSLHTAPEVPPVENLALVAHIVEDAAEIEFLNFFVTNQPVTFSAKMPLPERFWLAPHTNLASLNWRNLSCRLRIDHAHIAGFAPLLPEVVAPQGFVDADLGLVPGGKLDGQLRLDGVATRPFASVGILQDIEILCRFAGDNAQINSHATVGGHSVLGAGRVSIDPNELLRRELPPFEFRLTGENVPLTRQPDAIVRADVNVTVKHDRTQPVTISGDLHLRDSLYLRELRDLVPGRLASVDRRPPYFSVEAKPFSDWRLDLRAAGQRFLRVRTPIFNGEVSADLKLFGTLGDPVARGDVTINAGLVRFPFGNISVSQGIVSLTSDNPFRPQLLITGNDRVLGYEINMELAGFADAPVLQFNSTPPLSSDQILMMLTAGEIPRQGQFSFTAQDRAQRLALFLGRGVLSDLGIGGDSNRLTVRSGEQITETGRPTYSVEYELTEDWSVIGQYDRFNDFNLMLKWRVYAR